VIDQESLERAAQPFQPPEGSFERLVQRRARNRRNRKITTSVLAIIVALASFAGLIRAFRSIERPAEQRKDLFGAVHGWIAYGTKGGIWAVNPERTGDRRETLRLSDQPGAPIAWSSDGSKLLVMRAWSPNGTVADPTGYEQGWTYGLVLLNGDGTETPVVTFNADTNPFIAGSSLSPDGSRVAFVQRGPEPDFQSIYVVDADGGSPRLVRSTSMESFVVPEEGWRGMLQWPTFSPDGTQIAYVHGGGDHTEDLRVMRSNGSNARSLFGEMRLDGHIYGLDWSPDGSELAFATDHQGGASAIWMIGADGSGYRRVIVHGESPSWSPDGSRIAFRQNHVVYTAASDGTDLQEVAGVGAEGGIAWNPVD